jgi:hypothetical protein
VVVYDESDENQASTTIPAVVLAGMDSTGTPGILAINNSNSASKRGENLDMSSLFTALVSNFKGTYATATAACGYFSADDVSTANCTRKTAGTDTNPDKSLVLPMKINDPPIIGTVSTLVVADASTNFNIACNNDSGDLTVLAFATTGNPTVTPPTGSGWALAANGNDGTEIWYWPNNPNANYTGTFTFSSAKDAVGRCLAIQGVNGELDQSANDGSGSSTVTTGDTGLTAPIYSDGDQAVVGIVGIKETMAAPTFDSTDSTAGLVLDSEDQVSGLGVSTGITTDFNAAEQGYEGFFTWTGAAQFRGAIATFN